MSDAAIQVENLGKQYIIGHQRSPDDGLRHIVEDAVRAPFRWLRGERNTNVQEEFWALRDVSFTVERGEAIGVIGRNGAGKSTLLKLLSSITEPTTGQIRYKGRVASLLEVGTGFHPELTGRENIYLNAAILGMRRSDITKRFDEIVAFSEIEQFLDTPVKRYSSGMYVRLAFGVAAHLEPEILLIDEVLAVGDATFQKKCLGKMGSVVNEGRTVLFVSHNMAAISALCSRAIFIEKGRLESTGAPQALIEQYLARSRADASLPLAERTDRKGEGRVRLSGVSVLNDRMEPVENVSSGQDIYIAIETDLLGASSLSDVVFQIAFTGTVGQPMFACLSRVDSNGTFTLTPGRRVLCRIPKLPLMNGVYTYSVWVKLGMTMQDWVVDAGKLSVVSGDYFGLGRLPSKLTGDFLVSHNWSSV